MKILLYGTDNVKIFEKLVEIKQKYKKEQTYELTGEVGVDDLRQYLQGLSMFGSDELICFQVSKKTEITDSILDLLTDEISKNLVIVLYENLPKNSKLLKYFDQTYQFVADEKEKVFPLLDAISKKQSLVSVQNYYKLIFQKNDPIYINSMLFYQFKNILHARFKSNTFELINPFVKSRLSFVMNNFSDTECVNIIKEIYAVDLRLKTTSINDEVLVLNLILKIAN